MTDRHVTKPIAGVVRDTASVHAITIPTSVNAVQVSLQDGVHLLRELMQAQGESIFSGSSDGLYMESIVFQSELLRIKIIARRMDESDPSSHALDSCIGCIGDQVILKLVGKLAELLSM